LENKNIIKDQKIIECVKEIQKIEIDKKRLEETKENLE